MLKVTPVRRERLLAGMTQAELADKLNMTQQAVSKLEKGRTFLDMHRAMQIAEVLGIPANKLIMEAPLRTPAFERRDDNLADDPGFAPVREQNMEPEAELIALYRACPLRLRACFLGLCRTLIRTSQPDEVTKT